MARDVYSLRIFATGALTSSAGVVGPIVPAGLVYVLRDVDLFETTGAAGTFAQILSPVAGVLALFAGQAEPTTRSYPWRGRQVYAVGERVGFEVVSGTWSITASGYQLTLP